MSCAIDSIVSLKNLKIFSKKANRCLLSGFNLDISPGEIISLVGPSGSGKSTLINLILGILDSDNWVIEGDINISKDLAVGVVSQNPNLQLFSNFVYEEVSNKAILEELGIKELEKRRISDISAGEKSLVSLASALEKNPSLLILDEITSNLSVGNIKLVRDEIINLSKKSVAIIIAEHRRELIDISSRVIKLGEESYEEVHFMKKQRVFSTTDNQFLSIKNIHHPFIKKESISIDAPLGTIVGIYGDNAVGKTTFLNILSGLYPLPKDAEVVFGGKSLNKLKNRLGVVSWVGQDPYLQLFSRCAREEIKHTLDNFKLNPDVDKILENFNLQDVARINSLYLSYGQQQRLVLSAAICFKPKILLLDEPTHGMDRNNLNNFLNILLDYKDNGNIIFLVSHEEVMLKDICDNILYL